MKVFLAALLFAAIAANANAATKIFIVLPSK